MNRRSLILGAAALIAAPAVVRADSLMKLWVPKLAVPDGPTFWLGENGMYVSRGGEITPIAPDDGVVFRTSIPGNAWRDYYAVGDIRPFLRDRTSRRIDVIDGEEIQTLRIFAHPSRVEHA